MNWGEKFISIEYKLLYPFLVINFKLKGNKIFPNYIELIFIL